MSTRGCTRRGFIAAAGVTAAALARRRAAAAEDAPASGRGPNFIVILCDNLGYGDVGCFGSKRNRTPHLDAMAAEGMRFTSFYVTSGVCTPSRASLMTGCYPRRVNLHVDSRGGLVLRPVERKGLSPKEVTLAEVLKQRGYATACIGKWHLGDQPPFLPTRQGFDYYFGIPYSDDMVARKGTSWPPLPLMRNETVVEAPADRSTLTRRYTQETIRFITAHRDEPFLVYLPHAMPGSTRTSFASEAFRGKSGNGTYGDAVEEIDWSTGRILAALERLHLDARTLVVWTSDNGSVDRRHGSNAPLSGWGYTTAEGAMRVPCIVRWPGRVPAGGTCDELCSTMDLLPTLARLAGTKAPGDRIIDGKDIWPLMAGRPGAGSPHEAFYYYYRGQLQAVRSGKWKLRLPHAPRARKKPAKPVPGALYDLSTDVGEKSSLYARRPDIVKRLLALADKARADLGDGQQPGANQRPAGWVETARPLRGRSTRPASRPAKRSARRTSDTCEDASSV
jgi:arylsulfatase A